MSTLATKNPRDIFFSLTLALTIAVAGPVQWAFPATAAAQSREDIKQAKERFGEGRAFYEEENYVEAAEAFKDAYELSGRSELLYNIGQAYRLAGNLQEAERYFKQYLEERPDAPNHEEVVETIIEIQQEIAAQIATIEVTTAEQGREVFIDSENEARCATPCSVQVAPGKYKLTVRGKGAQDDSRNVELEPSQKLSLDITLKRSIVPGRLILYTDRPGGQLRVGTDVTEALPLQNPISLNPGDYSVEVRDDEVSWRGTIRIEPEETTQLLVPMRPLAEAKRRNSPWKAVAYSLWGVSAAITVGGLVMGLQTQDTYDLLTQQQADRNGVDGGVVDQGRSQQLATNIMFGAGVLTAAAGIGLFLWDTLSVDEAESSFPIGPSGPVRESPRPTPEVEEEAPQAEQDESDEAPDGDEPKGDGIDLL